ncbi:hypothetical protein Bca52824_036702 [Brassica carinata]|uniref:DUF6821 domain-containing protein n=1 Tax=Brassica carinata TaxID=52824 RepID=A0A8X7S5D2_BRACI|nr:hypothetical protein Bca52824_036702 [Brassica carinata]
MDLEEWELLPKNLYKGLDLDHDEDHEAATRIIRNTEKTSTWITSSAQHKILRHRSPEEPGSDQLLTESVPSPRITFKTAKENEFVDMKIDLPARFTSPLPQKDDKHSHSGRVLAGEYYGEMGTEVEEGGDMRSKKKVDWEEEENKRGEKMNLWKMGLHGIGAICSFGVATAAATFYVFFLGRNSSIRGCRNKNQTIRFQIYSDDNKRVKEVVKHATKLNEAISVLKGLPVARAQISFGGHYDGL